MHHSSDVDLISWYLFTIGHSNLRDDLPLIAVMAATTTRKIDKPSTKNLSLFMYLLPSLIRTLDCGFRYEYVMGYDKGDPFYDSKEVSGGDIGQL